MPKSTSPLTPTIAQAHERLYPRVVTLLAQVERLAARRPRDPVPEAMLSVAQELFREARKVLGREAARMAGNAAGDAPALAVRLGQLRAALEAFEAANSGWSRKLGGIAWRFDGHAEQLVSRLRPTRSSEGMAQVARAGRAPDFGHMGKTRSEALANIYKRMNEREAEAYAQGYEDAAAGRPMTPPEPLGKDWLPPSSPR